MKRFRSSLFCTPLIVGASVLLTAGCRHHTPMPTGAGDAGGVGAPVDVPAGGGAQDAPQPPKADNPVQVSLLTDKTTYKPRETLKFTVVARNGSDEPASVIFNTGQMFDIEATREGEDTPVWRWSTGKMFTMMVRKITLAPKEEKRYEGTWDGKTVNADGTAGTPLTLGRYMLRARLAIAGNVYAPPVTVEIAQ